MAADGDLWDHTGYVTASEYRQLVLTELQSQPATPSTLGDRCDLKITHVSRALNELRERELVELLVPEERRKGRIYGATDLGEEVEEHLETLGGDER